MDKNFIWVTFQQEGMHKYPAAATNPALKDVAFLANPHRHIFHFRVDIQVFHDDRDLEFILEKRFLQGLYSGGVLELNYKSCEMIARDLHAQVCERYQNREIVIEVSEDGENGCRLIFAPIRFTAPGVRELLL